MNVYLVVCYFKYEGGVPASICSTLPLAIAEAQRLLPGYDGVEIEEFTVDSTQGPKTVFTEKVKQ